MLDALLIEHRIGGLKIDCWNTLENGQEIYTSNAIGKIQLWLPTDMNVMITTGGNLSDRQSITIPTLPRYRTSRSFVLFVANK